MKLSAGIANTLWVASNLPAWRSFGTALRDPAGAQRRWLCTHLERNAECDFARQHKLASVRSYEEFARRVPLLDYEQTESWINRVQRGQANVLTSEAVTHLIPTGGSTGARKLIPFTSGLQRDFDRAIGPWICDLARQYPGILGGPAYWSITPAMRQREAEHSAVPVGFADDASYLGGLKGWLVRTTLVAPRNLAADHDLEMFQFETLRCLLGERELRLISVWHPSFLTLLLDALPRHWERLLAVLPDPQRLRDVGPHCLEQLWPHLQLISCWGDAQAELALADLRHRFPHTHIQPKGLLATEAFVTVPFGGAHPVAVQSHFFEFLDEDGRLRLVHELEEGQNYEVVVTTSGGLWRYRLGDLVRVSGLMGKTPSLRFLGRTGNVSDRFGEKLSEHFVADVIREVTAGISPPPLFAMLAPTDKPVRRYVLYVEGEVRPGSSSRMDELLRCNPQYDVCRRLGQLEEVGICQVRGGYNALVAHEMSKGRRLGEIKPKALSQELGWPTRFGICPDSEGRLLNESARL